MNIFYIWIFLIVWKMKSFLLFAFINTPEKQHKPLVKHLAQLELVFQLVAHEVQLMLEVTVLLPQQPHPLVHRLHVQRTQRLLQLLLSHSQHVQVLGYFCHSRKFALDNEKENTVLRKKKNCHLHLAQNNFLLNSLFHSLKVFYCCNKVKTKSSLPLNLWIKTLVPSDRISFY